MNESTWTTKDGKTLKVSEMEKDHAGNCYWVLVRRNGRTETDLTTVGNALHLRAYGRPAPGHAKVDQLFKRSMRKELKNIFGNERYWED